jgi:hypothetical protein
MFVKYESQALVPIEASPVIFPSSWLSPAASSGKIALYHSQSWKAGCGHKLQKKRAVQVGDFPTVAWTLLMLIFASQPKRSVASEWLGTQLPSAIFDCPSACRIR